MPVARHPLTIGRRIAPDAADPEVIITRDVPAPVSRDPLDVLTGRLLIRRHFLDRLWRLLRDHRSRGRIVHHRRGERLVDRAAREDLPALRIGLVSRLRRSTLAIGSVGDRRRSRSRGRILSACRAKSASRQFPREASSIRSQHASASSKCEVYSSEPSLTRQHRVSAESHRRGGSPKLVAYSVAVEHPLGRDCTVQLRIRLPRFVGVSPPYCRDRKIEKPGRLQALRMIVRRRRFGCIRGRQWPRPRRRRCSFPERTRSVKQGQPDG